MRSPPASRRSPARKSTARPAAPKAGRPTSRRWPSAITITGGNGHDRHHHRRRHRYHPARLGLQDSEARDHRRFGGGPVHAGAEQVRDEADQMTIAAIIVAAVLGFLVLRFVA